MGKLRVQGSWRNLPLAKIRGVGRRWGACPGASRPARPGQPGEKGGMALLGPARVLLGGEHGAPPRRSPGAAQRRRRPEARPGLGTARVSCPSEHSIDLHVRVCMRLGDSQGWQPPPPRNFPRRSSPRTTPPPPVRQGALDAILQGGSKVVRRTQVKNQLFLSGFPPWLREHHQNFFRRPPRRSGASCVGAKLTGQVLEARTPLGGRCLRAAVG